MAYNEAKHLVGTSASICQIIQFFSGIFVCQKFMKKGTSDEISGFPFIFGSLSCGLWTEYSNLLGDWILIYVNLFGSLLMFSYVIVYFIYSNKRSKLIKIILVVIGVFLTVHSHIKLLDNKETKKKHLGIVCSLVTILFFAAPLSELARVIRQKSSDSLPFPIIFSSFIVSFLWSLYGYLLKDGFVMYLNLTGFGLTLVQLILIIIYPARWMASYCKSVKITIPEHNIIYT